MISPPSKAIGRDGSHGGYDGYPGLPRSVAKFAREVDGKVEEERPMGDAGLVLHPWGAALA